MSQVSGKIDSENMQLRDCQVLEAGDEQEEFWKQEMSRRHRCHVGPTVKLNFIRIIIRIDAM
jgi:hypothetical protein